MKDVRQRCRVPSVGSTDTSLSTHANRRQQTARSARTLTRSSFIQSGEKPLKDMREKLVVVCFSFFFSFLDVAVFTIVCITSAFPLLVYSSRQKKYTHKKRPECKNPFPFHSFLFSSKTAKFFTTATLKGKNDSITEIIFSRADYYLRVEPRVHGDFGGETNCKQKVLLFALSRGLKKIIINK